MQIKTRKEREKLEESLTSLIMQYNANEEVYDYIVDKLKDKMNEGDVAKIWGTNRPLRFVTDMELLLFSQAMHEKTKDERINPKNIFSENDLKESLHVYKEKKLSQQTLTFKNVTQINDEIWDVPFVSCRELIKGFDNGIINYNLKAQREAKKKEVLGQEILVPKIFDDKIREIAEELVNDTYIPVDSTIINILKTGAEKIDYNRDTKELTLHKVELSTNDLIDGGNRTEASRLALSINPNLPDTIGFGLKVTNFTLAKSQKCIKQINKQTPISKERVKSFEPTKYMKIAKELNKMEDEETNILYKRLGDSINDLKVFNKISTIQILADGIENSFKDILTEKSKVYTDILDYLFEFFNVYLGNFYEFIEDAEKARENTVLLDMNMFLVHTQVARELYHLFDKKRIWRQKVKEVVDYIDFSKSNNDWEKLKTTGSLSEKNKILLLDYVTNKVQECLREEQGGVING